ncbi:MAG TPA: hypothetical protein VJ978_10555 [Nitriliruptoraceae bacterium]|nr:hypothetical protein [Nitriliruptoraceae bacterium]
MMQRVVVRGTSGSGKTTFAAALAACLGVPHVELDALFHQAGWRPRPVEDFRAEVAATTAGDRWVVDGNYAAVQDDLRARADTVVWLDLPRWLVTRRVLWRTVMRGVMRQELWNGNRESLASLVRRDPEHNIVAWSWTSWPRRHAEAVADSSGSGPDHLTVVRLTSPSGTATFLDAVAGVAVR